MAGYTPLFGSLTTGTLCGRWPDIGLWPIVLSLSDKHGVVDVTPAYISVVTGLPVGDVASCMKRFCEPDPYSRSASKQGARLVLLDEHRDWGWRIVNHGLYRERARLASKNAREIESGANAERMKTAAHRRSPPKTAAQRPSYANADSDSNKEEEGIGKRAVRAQTAKRLPENFELTPERQATARAEAVNPEREFARFCDHWRAASGSNARKHDWDAAWRNWCRKAGDFKGGKSEVAEPVQRWEPPEDEHATV